MVELMARSGNGTSATETAQKDAPVQGQPTMKYAGVREMTPREWSKVRDNPRQRDTEAHAKRATHLRTPHPAHCKVNMARLPEGDLYKLDGHTRAYVWTMGTVPPPAILFVDVWDCATIDDVKDLYTTFDSRGAVESTVDQMFGGIRESTLQFESPLLKSLRFAAAMRAAYELLFGQVPGRTISTYDLLRYWTPELKLFDRCDPSRKRFPSGVTAAALITFRRHGANAADFWSAYARGAGSKIGTEMDPVQAFEERIRRLTKINGLSGRGNIQDIVAIAISAYERHRAGESYVVGGKDQRGGGIKGLKSNTLRAWFTAAKNTKRVW